MSVPVIPEPGCIIEHCWTNVPAVMATKGGKLISGRAVWRQADGAWLHLEAHAVWERPDGSVVDLTPKSDGETKIVYTREPLAYHGYRIPSRYIKLSKSQKIGRLIDLMEKKAAIEATIPCGAKRRLSVEDSNVLHELTALTGELFGNRPELWPDRFKSSSGETRD